MSRTNLNFRTACAEYIALSSFFHQVPAPVVRNTDNSLPTSQRYILPFSKERGLTETLAFMAKTKDGSEHIPAVCVRESQSGTALDIILAINKRTYTDGDDILQNLKASFEQVFQILNESDYDKPGVQRRVLMSIVSMCSPRILCRLRLERNAKRKPIQGLLKDAMFSVRQVQRQKLLSKDLSSTMTLFITEASEVIHLVDRWSKHQNLEELSDLVEGIHHLHQTAPRLEGLLDIISNKDMDPNSRSCLLNIIRKLSRYWEAARKLYRTAKKFPLVRNMKIRLASLPQKAFEGEIHSSQIPNLCACLAKLGFPEGRQNIPLLCQSLRLDQNAACVRYQKAQRALSASKIHAEIQVIAFCEIQSQDPFPRVVNSSKDACFLCDTFIQLYGRMHMPKTHGRLYPGWRLPSLPVFGALQQRFNEKLAETLRRNISRGLAQRKLPIYPWPNESNLLTLSDSLTTVNQPDLTAQNSEGKVTPLGSSCNLADNSPRHGRSLPLIETPHTVRLSHNPLEAVYLADGELLNDSVRPIDRFRLYIAGCFEIYLELESPSASETKEESLSYGIKRCSAGSFEPSPEKSVIDVRQLNGEDLFQLSRDTVICLASSDVILEINIRGWTKDEKQTPSSGAAVISP